MDLDGDSDESTVRDSEPATEGGPPGWLAFAVVAGLFLIAVVCTALIAALSG